jgi:hypothetical protein
MNPNTPERPCIRNPDGTYTPLWLLTLKSTPQETAYREKFEPSHEFFKTTVQTQA